MKRTGYQEKSINSIIDKFQSSSSRVFLADEAGLGKTVTASGVMDKLYEDNFKNNKPMVVIYVAPSKFIAQNATAKLIKHSENKDIIISQNTKNSGLEKIDRITDFITKSGTVENLKNNAGKIIVLSISSEVMGKECVLRAGSFKSISNDITDEEIESAKKCCSKIEVKEKTIEFIKSALSSHEKCKDDFECIYSLVEKNFNSDNKDDLIKLYFLVGKIYSSDHETIRLLKYYRKKQPKQPDDFTEKIIASLAERIYDIGNINIPKQISQPVSIGRYNAELDILKQINPALIIWDEFHRYKSLMQAGSNAYFEVEKCNTKALFLSATPYHSNISGINKKSIENNRGVEKVVNIEILPSFEDFCELFYKGYGTYKNNADANNLIKLSNNYIQAMASLCVNVSEDNWNKAVESKKVFNDEMSKVLIRHERTILAGYDLEKFIDLFEPNSIFDGNKLKDEYKSVFQQTWENRFADVRKRDAVVKEWVLQLPYLLSFRREYGGRGKVYEGLPQEDLDGPEYRNIVLATGNEIYKKQIKNLVNYDLQFHEIIKQISSYSDNEKIGKELLLWVPPAYRYYHPGDDSIFEKYRDYSKLLIFAEQVPYQRGIAFLLSEYQDMICEVDDIDLDGVDFSLEYAKNASDEKKEKWSICSKDSLDDLIKTISNDSDIKDEDEAMAIIGSPAYCALRLGLDANIVEGYFNSYFNVKSVKKVLIKWMHAKKITCPKKAVLRYCCEGNLYAVLKEWSMENNGEFLDNIAILGQIQSLTEIKADLSEGEKTKECNYAIRLSVDKHDNGSSASKQEDDPREELAKHFVSPFWPMVLVTGRGAQESMDFHAYCMKVMHYTIPDGAVSLEQREGRINRYRSLLVKRRVAEYACSQGKGYESIEEIFDELEKNKSDKGDIYPNWQFDNNSGHYHFQRLVAQWPYTDEWLKWEDMKKMRNNYRALFGTIESYDDIKRIVDQLNQSNSGKHQIEDVIIDLQAYNKQEKQ